MSAKPGKKYIVLSPETYEMLIQNQRTKSNKAIQEGMVLNPYDNDDDGDVSSIRKLMLPPEKLAMLKADREMKDVWNRPELSDDEKVKQYTKEMNTFKTFHDTLTAPRPMEVKFDVNNNSSKNNNKDNNTVEKDKKLHVAATAADASAAKALQPRPPPSTEYVISNLPKSMKKTAGLLEQYLRQYSDRVAWNERGELIYRGDIIRGSNVSDLFRNILTKTGKHDKSGTLPTSTFTKILAELNVPEEWIRNEKQLNLYHAYRQRDSHKEKEEEEEEEEEEVEGEKRQDSKKMNRTYYSSTASYESPVVKRKKSNSFNNNNNKKKVSDVKWLSSTNNRR
ncbi:uncharacterized protein LOC130629866 [Hydractinia symbiolongicarpus]|uniref:uncharacterized protein LOC130629866 n=1 Tax=Hydractinia symbiolongicarpus TaxID=13093 RepID=UPI0025514370|nr:uncharacterized protein LOC130629866 [Hydractinia symbiolongicarpus]